MSVVYLLTSAGRAFSAWRRRERAYADLMALDDHSLADIGLHRSQIAAVFGGVRTPDPILPPVRARQQFVRHRAA
jgi:uncharacterized protein YjiS (DUF1127 family)